MIYVQCTSIINFILKSNFETYITYNMLSKICFLLFCKTKIILNKKFSCLRNANQTNVLLFYVHLLYYYLLYLLQYPKSLIIK